MSEATELQKKSAAEHFAANKSHISYHVTSDGQCFVRESDAINHAKDKGFAHDTTVKIHFTDVLKGKARAAEPATDTEVELTEQTKSKLNATLETMGSEQSKEAKETAAKQAAEAAAKQAKETAAKEAKETAAKTKGKGKK